MGSLPIGAVVGAAAVGAGRGGSSDSLGLGTVVVCSTQ